MTKKFLYIPMLVLIALSMVIPTTAMANGEIKANLTIQGGEELTVGDPIVLTLSVTHPENYQVIPVALETVWGDFHTQSITPTSSVSNPDGTATTTQVIDARLFTPGTFSTPPLTVSLSDPGGNLVEVVAQPVEVTINSVLIEGDSNLRDIKPQAELPYRNLLPWIIAGALLIVLAVVSLVLWRRRRMKLTLAPVDNRLPHEIALDELLRIEKMDLPRFHRFKEYYTMVSDTVRVYMERTYHIPVLERTTSEIRTSFKQAEVPKEVSGRFVTFLDDCDLVKFSKFRPDETSAYRILTEARQIIEDTRPVYQDIGEESGMDQTDTPSKPNYSKSQPNPSMEMSA